MVDIPMSTPPTKDRSILAVSESGRISLDAPKLKALLLALLTALGGWQAHGALSPAAPAPITRQEWDEHISKQEADLQRIEAKLDQLLLKMAKTSGPDQKASDTVGETLATIASIQ